MPNILVLGVGPLPFEQTEKLHAPGLRTWQMAELLARKRHHVTIGLIEFGDFDGKQSGPPKMSRREELGDNISMVRLQYHPQHTVTSLQTLHMGTRFTCVISTTDIMNNLAAQMDVRLPLWLDFNGEPFSEKQLQALVHHNDVSLKEQWKMYLPALLAGDRFSVASTMQKYAMIGQLGFAGRLTQHTCGTDLVHIMPNCSRAMQKEARRRNLALKGHLIPATAFMVLWTGGYNTWCDPETLYRGLELAMRQDDDVFFVSTGGAIVGHDTESFAVFQRLVENSQFRDRFHFVGWRGTDEVASVYQQADCAICTDRYSVEGEMGTRTRIVDWIQFKVPIVTTDLCELTHQLAEHDLAETYRIGSPEALRDAIFSVKNNPETAQERADRARRWFEQTYVEEQIFEPLLEWAAHPTFAPDRQLIADSSAASRLDVRAKSRLAELQMFAVSAHWTNRSAGGLKKLFSRILPGKG
jgi:glycosyltransferase involved in cell wall biosynthesis